MVLPFLFSFSVSLSSKSVQSRIVDIYIYIYIVCANFVLCSQEYEWESNRWELHNWTFQIHKYSLSPPTRRWRLPLSFKYIWWVCVWQSEETKWPEYLPALAVFILFQLTGDQGFCCVASNSFLNTVSSWLHWSKDIIVVDVVAHVHCHLGIYTSADMTSNCPLFNTHCLIHSQKK